MKKLLTILLTLFLFSSIYADERAIKVVGNKGQIMKIVEEQITILGSEADLNHLDVSEVTNMASLFEWSDFNGDISKWDVSSVTNMNEMFKVSQFNGDISKWDVSNVTEKVQEYIVKPRMPPSDRWSNTAEAKSIEVVAQPLKSTTNKISPQFKAIKFKKLSKQDIFKTFSDKVIVFDMVFKDYQDKTKYPICVEVTSTTTKALESGKYKSTDGDLINCNPMKIKDVWAEYMSGKLCVETHQRAEICKRIRSFSNQKYKFGFSPIAIHSKLSPLFNVTKAPTTSVISLFIGPDSMKTTVYRGGDVAEQTEAVFVDRNHRVEGENKLREKWRAKWKAAWKEGRIIDDLTKEEFILNPDLEGRFSKYRDDAIGLFYSDNKKDREDAVVILRKLAFAGSSPAYYDLIFRSPDSSYEEDNKLQFYKLFGNMFEYSFSKRDKTKVSNEMIILAKDNPNNNADQNELIRSLLLLSQKKFQHYNHLINIAGADMFLSYMILSTPGSQSNTKTEYFLAARFDRNEIGKLSDYLLTNEEIVRNLEKETEDGDVMSMMFLVNMYNPKDMYKTLKQIVPPNDKKAIFYSKKIIEYIKAHKDDVDIKKSPSLARKAYETLRELKDESMMEEVNLYFKEIDDAKSKKDREVRKQGQFCTVSFMEGDKPKRKTYTYYKTKDCLDHIKHADENGYLNKGRFKNGNNPLIFWGPQGTYEGTKNLMKNHKPLNK